MMLETEIQFRGETREVQFEHEGDGVILWSFPGDTHDDGMGGATDAEQQEIYETLWAWLLDWWDTPVDDGE